jgi:outer membrane immunogenic protein
LAAAATWTIAGVADAAESAKAPVNFSWAGAYAGATAGYGWGKSDYIHITTDWFDFAGGTYQNKVSGLLGGGLVGLNLQHGNLVLGVEGQMLASGARGGKDYTIYSNSQATILNWLGTVSGRVGVAADTWLFYGKGGYAVGSVTAENLYYTAPTHAWSVTNSHGGWVVGAGIEKAVGGHLIVGVDYNYVNLAKVENNHPDSGGTPTNIANNLILHSVMGRVSLKY